MDTAVRWSVSGGCPTGDPNLHHYAGELYYKGELGVAVYLTLTPLPYDMNHNGQAYTATRSLRYCRVLTSDRQFAQAETHLLASGKRDSANLLAELLFEWYVGTDSSHLT